ncbi:hypothetical protein K5L04_09680 [Flavobacterium psychrophilum]|uniref:hypothetical protein n=1 Tax=Flavobacterium psychrophilum TaxID=96345 RepID=UPI001C8F3383|nr:hypothetical protein [Flavobacterium psychrophilum]QZK99964.1 hypothetical protein K5L04_09680 [Flavobacterium psychrophilum]
MNHHLNLFHFYNESHSLEFLENNLSRAFSITLLNSSLFFNEFIRNIVTEGDYDYLFSTYSSEVSYFDIDIQIDIAQIENESYKKVYAVALTTNKIDLSDFFEQESNSNKNITDIVITIKDIVIIIEVKKNSENCKNQLFNQVKPFIKRKEEGIDVVSKSITWHKIVTLMEKVHNLEKTTSSSSPFLKDFLKFAEIKRPNWFKPKPFNTLRFSTKGIDNHHLMQRMRQALSNCKYPLLDYSDRLGLSVPFKWASEVIPYFYHYDNCEFKDYIGFHIWPGNTKTQGYHFYNNPMSWIDKKNLIIEDKEYELEIIYNIKICHFNKYITGLNFTKNDIIKTLHTPDNFYNKSGKWDIKNWSQFEKFLDDHFKPDFKWRERCKWYENILGTDRTYFTMSLGFEVTLFIPYIEFCEIDKKEEDVSNVTNKINEILDTLENLLKSI